MSNSDALFIARKLRDAEEKVAALRGGFNLFGLFERQHSPGRWTIVAAAPWLGTGLNDITGLVALLRSNMDTGDWKVVSAVFPTEASSEFAQLVIDKYDLKHALQEVYDPSLGDETPGHAFLITADKFPAPAQADLVPELITA